MHTKLAPLRQKRREFFNIYPDEAFRAVQSVLSGTADIEEVERPIRAPRRDAAVSHPRRRHKQPTRATHMAQYAHLLDAFTELLNVKGRVFGQINKPVFGISDGRSGVQWNLAVYPTLGEARIGVNLEGMAYKQWPIATLIQSEIERPTLPSLISRLSDPELIYLRFVRDAWQVSSRPKIAEEYLGDKEIPLSRLDSETWARILSAALSCLDESRDYKGRSRQLVTVVKRHGAVLQPKTMPVSPHLTIWTAIDPTAAPVEMVAHAIERLAPIHSWVAEVGGE